MLLAQGGFSRTPSVVRAAADAAACSCTALRWACAFLPPPPPSLLPTSPQPALRLTPTNRSQLFSPNGFESLSASQAATPRTATDSLAGEMSSSFLSPQVGALGGAPDQDKGTCSRAEAGALARVRSCRSPPRHAPPASCPQRSSISIVGAAPHPPAMDLGIPGLEPPPHLVDVGGGPGSGVLAAGSSGPFSSSMPGSLSARSLSAIGAGLMGAAPGTARGFEAGSLPGTARGFEVGSLPTGGGTGLYRSVSDGRAALAAGLPRTSSHPALQTYGSLPRQAAAVLSPASRSPRPVGADTGGRAGGVRGWGKGGVRCSPALCR